MVVLKQAVALDDKVASAHLYLALVQISAGEKYYNDGFNELQRAYELNPYLYQQEKGMVAGYYILLQHYYGARDARAKVCAQVLEFMVPEKKDGLEMIIKNIDDGLWSYIEFK
jgi:hypothetical protein